MKINIKKLLMIILLSSISFLYAKPTHHYKTTSLLNKKIFFINNPNPNERLSKENFLNLLLAGQYGITINIEDKKAQEILQQKMPYVVFKNIPLKEILNRVIGNQLFWNYNPKNKTLNISYYETKIFNLNFVNNDRSGSSSFSSGGISVKNDFKFSFWKKVKKDIETILKNTSKNYKEPIVDPTAGLVVVKGNKEQLELVQNYLQRLIKKMTKEVLIDVRIYSVTLDKSHQTGINWSKLNIALGEANPLSVPLRVSNILGSNSVFSLSTFNVQGFVSFLRQYGKVKAISNPKIVTLNNQKAVVSVGDTVYYKYQSGVTTDQNGNPIAEYTIGKQFVGVSLSVTPEVGKNGIIILSIYPTITNFRDPTQLTNTNRDMPPDITQKTLNILAKLKDGETLIIGGVMSSTETINKNSVPVLSDLPILGNLFKGESIEKTKKELVFVITPHIINLNRKLSVKRVLYGN